MGNEIIKLLTENPVSKNETEEYDEKWLLEETGEKQSKSIND